MSGGHYCYTHFQMDYLADEMEHDLKTDFKVDCVGEEADYLAELPEDQREAFKNRIVKKLIYDLRNISKRAEALDMFLSGDYGLETFLKEWDELTKNNQVG